VAVDDVIAALVHHFAHTAHTVGEAFVEHGKRDTQRLRLLGKGAAHKADQVRVYGFIQFRQKRKHVRFGAAAVSAAYEMYNFQGILHLLTVT
jgi:hypothetical protein